LGGQASPQDRIAKARAEISRYAERMETERDEGTDWRRFFDAHAARYEENAFTQFTIEEVDFLLALFALPPKAKILDMGCGTGRHAIELARRGFEVTGVDFSLGMLHEAERRAQEAGVALRLVHEDATRFRTKERYDLGICLCEGGFGLIGAGDDPEEHDQAILVSIAEALRPGAPFLLTALNGYSMIRQVTDDGVKQGAFDPATMVARYRDTWNLPEGPKTMQVRERLFIPPEVVRMLKKAGFQVSAVYGGTAGEWGKRPLKLDEVEAMYVCKLS
jgi:2-polyprenyl-3-methyl-5-hydroxy-6-metoxy-1,4-benzoquinol methylase